MSTSLLVYETETFFQIKLERRFYVQKLQQCLQGGQCSGNLTSVKTYLLTSGVKSFTWCPR